LIEGRAREGEQPGERERGWASRARSEFPETGKSQGARHIGEPGANGVVGGGGERGVTTFERAFRRAVETCTPESTISKDTSQ
jgi:hypothetical protein